MEECKQCNELKKVIGGTTAIFFNKDLAEKMSDEQGFGWEVKKIEIEDSEFFAVYQEI